MQGATKVCLPYNITVIQLNLCASTVTIQYMTFCYNCESNQCVSYNCESHQSVSYNCESELDICGRRLAGATMSN